MPQGPRPKSAAGGGSRAHVLEEAVARFNSDAPADVKVRAARAPPPSLPAISPDSVIAEFDRGSGPEWADTEPFPIVWEDESATVKDWVLDAVRSDAPLDRADSNRAWVAAIRPDETTQGPAAPSAARGAASLASVPIAVRPARWTPAGIRRGLGFAAMLGGFAVVAVRVPWRDIPAPGPAAPSIEQWPAPAAGPLAATRPTPEPQARLHWTIADDPDASTENTMSTQLGVSLAPGEGSATPARNPAWPGFAIARFDALRAAPAGWRVVAPLHTEEIYAIVRADSPLQRMDDLRGRRINVGAPGSPRAVSGAALYRQLFDAALPAVPSAEWSRDAALQHLLDGTGVDALLLFDGQPSSWLAGLPQDTRHRLRLLAADPSDASTRRAMQVYLPAHVSATLAARGAEGSAGRGGTGSTDGTVPTLAVVAFLVTAKPTADAVRVVEDLCGRLPALRQGGHPKWREVRPELQLPSGLPTAPGAAQAALRACAEASADRPTRTATGA